MSIDETNLADRLHRVFDPVEADPSLAANARTLGRARVWRRRLAAATVVAVSVAVGLGSMTLPLGGASGREVLVGSSGSRTTTEASTTTTTTTAGPVTAGSLYAQPPRAGVNCMEGGSRRDVQIGTYPKYDLLPAVGAVTSDFEYSQRQASTLMPGCEPPHVALTLLKSSGASITQGIVVQGPNAPSFANVGGSGPYWGAEFKLSRCKVQGLPASIVAAPAQDDYETSVYWSAPFGAQWEVLSTGIDRASLVATLDHLELHPASGMASLPNPAASGWTVAPAVADFAPGPSQGFSASVGHVQIQITEGPDRTDQDVATLPNSSLVTVRGKPAALEEAGTMPQLTWQYGSDVTVSLSALAPMSAAQLERIAATVAPATLAEVRARS